MSKRRKRHALPAGHRVICGCGQHDRGSCPHEVRAPKGAPRAAADKPSEATTEAYRGTSEASLAEDYAAKAALGIIGSDQ